MAADLELSLEQARRLAVRGQHLAGPPPATGLDGMRQVLRGLRVLQLDPVNVVARSHLLVLWSRLGGFDRDHLDTLLWRERWLFEYWAHAASIVLTEDYPIHRAMMRSYPVLERKREWLAANEEFRRYVLDVLRDCGPLPGSDLEDRSAVGWTSGGWTNGRNVEQLLDILWKQGVIMVAGRDGLRRLWALADLPGLGPRELPQAEVAPQAAEHALRALGVARARDVERHFIPGRYGGFDLASAGWARPVRVEGGNEQWWVHRDVLERLDQEWMPRTTLLSPFDNLICDRDRTERLWGFVYRSEMYVPKLKRQFGAYVMPVLSGERLTGRVSSRVDRRRKELVVEAVFAEAGSAPDPLLPAALESLASFAGADAVVYSGAAIGVS
jgi:hypothetical protein